jgi:hypothetical protein
VTNLTQAQFFILLTIGMFAILVGVRIRASIRPAFRDVASVATSVIGFYGAYDLMIECAWKQSASSTVPRVVWLTSVGAGVGGIAFWVFWSDIIMGRKPARRKAPRTGTQQTEQAHQGTKPPDQGSSTELHMGPWQKALWLSLKRYFGIIKKLWLRLTS